MKVDTLDWLDKVVCPHQDQDVPSDLSKATPRQFVSIYLENMLDNGDDVTFEDIDTFEQLFDAAKRGAHDWAESYFNNEGKGIYWKQEEILKVSPRGFIKRR